MKSARKKKSHTKNTKKRTRTPRAARTSSVPVAKPIGWPESSLDPSLRLTMARHEDDLASDAGQSGDTTLISDVATADSESVKDLVEEGQDFEAEIISGVERAADAEESVMKPRRRKDEPES